MSEKNRRKKWLDPIANMPFWEIEVNYLRELTNRQLEATLRAMDSCTNTNCWFAYLDAAKHYRPYVVALLEGRKSIKSPKKPKKQ